MATLKSNVVITLGMMPLGVNVKTIVEGEKSTSMSNVCVGTTDSPHDPIRIKQINRCPIEDCANEDKESHAKAKAVSKTELVLVPQTEIDAMSEEAKKYTEAMPITLHSTEDVLASTIETGTAYFLEPSGPAFAPVYATLVSVIKKHPEKSLITMWAARSAPTMYRFGVRDDVLVIRQLAWPHQVQAAPSVPKQFDPAWEAQAEMFLMAAEAEFDPTTYKDARGDILSNYVASQTPIFATEPASTVKAGGLDFMELLRRSTEEAVSKTSGAVQAAKPVKKAAAKKATTKKAASSRKSA